MKPVILHVCMYVYVHIHDAGRDIQVAASKQIESATCMMYMYACMYVCLYVLCIYQCMYVCIHASFAEVDVSLSSCYSERMKVSRTRRNVSLTQMNLYDSHTQHRI